MKIGMASPHSNRTPPTRARGQDWLYGEGGLRAGWRLLSFAALVSALFAVNRLVLSEAEAAGVARDARFVGERLLIFVAFLLASWIMGRIEGRTLADYGLPWRLMFGRRFWQGVAIGFTSLTLLLAILAAVGAFHFGEIVLRGADVGKFAGLYLAVFLIIAFREEFQYRGYGLFTLASGIGFWPAAVVSGLYFGYDHLGNSGETSAGVATVVAGGLLWCLMLRRSGSLWMPIGFHTAWDWGETFFYGVPNSGHTAPGSLLMSRVSGPAWLSGGTAGPEGSWLCAPLLAGLALILGAWLRDVAYPAAPVVSATARSASGAT
jgi:membrane protease YdiL (CAAX protease family)